QHETSRNVIGKRSKQITPTEEAHPVEVTRSDVGPSQSASASPSSRRCTTTLLPEFWATSRHRRLRRYVRQGSSFARLCSHMKSRIAGPGRTSAHSAN